MVLSELRQLLDKNSDQSQKLPSNHEQVHSSPGSHLERLNERSNSDCVIRKLLEDPAINELCVKPKIDVPESSESSGVELDPPDFDQELLEHTDERTNEAERNKIVLVLPTGYGQ